MAETQYLSGRPWACCDRCATQVRHDTLRKEWSGLLVCRRCFDPEPAQSRPPHIRPEGLPIPNARPEPADVFVEPGDVTRDDL